jgi:hypothetical protein
VLLSVLQAGIGDLQFGTILYALLAGLAGDSDVKLNLFSMSHAAQVHVPAYARHML